MWTLVVLDKRGTAIYHGSFISPQDTGQFVEKTLGIFLGEGADCYVVVKDGVKLLEYSVSDAVGCVELSNSHVLHG